MSLDKFAVFPPTEGGFSSEQVDQIVAMANHDETSEGTVGVGTVNPAQRRSSVQWIKHSPASSGIFEHLYTLVAVCNERLDWKFEIAGMEPSLQLTGYDEKVLGHYDWHLDVGGTYDRRKVSLVALLTDPSDFVGGVFQLLRAQQADSPRLVAGSVVVFPSFLLHRVTPVVNGFRWSLVGWACGKASFG